VEKRKKVSSHHVVGGRRTNRRCPWQLMQKEKRRAAGKSKKDHKRTLAQGEGPEREEITSIGTPTGKHAYNGNKERETQDSNTECKGEKKRKGCGKENKAANARSNPATILFSRKGSTGKHREQQSEVGERVT